MFAGHDIKDISEGNEIEKNANIMSVSWRLPLVSEYPRKEKKKAELRKANRGNPRIRGRSSCLYIGMQAAINQYNTPPGHRWQSTLASRNPLSHLAFILFMGEFCHNFNFCNPSLISFFLFFFFPLRWCSIGYKAGSQRGSYLSNSWAKGFRAGEICGTDNAACNTTQCSQGFTEIKGQEGC